MAQTSHIENDGETNRGPATRSRWSNPRAASVSLSNRGKQKPPLVPLPVFGFLHVV